MFCVDLNMGEINKIILFFILFFFNIIFNGILKYRVLKNIIYFYGFF